MTDIDLNHWCEWLTALDVTRTMIDGQLVRDWPDQLIVELTRHALLHELPAATCVACPGCDEAPFRDVIFTETQLGVPRALLPCPNCGLSEFPLSELRRWQPDPRSLCDGIRESLSLRGRSREVIPDKLWELGRLKRAELKVPVWFGLQTWRRNTIEQVTKLQLSSPALLLVPNRRPLSGFPAGTAVGVLTELTEWNSDRMEWDEGQLTPLLASIVQKAPRTTKPVPQRRQTRASDIEALVGELREHLRAARDHAYQTLDATGVARLLPRPTQKELARRLGITESRLSRSLNDSAAQQLKLLWELAENLDGILHYGR